MSDYDNPFPVLSIADHHKRARSLSLEFYAANSLPDYALTLGFRCCSVTYLGSTTMSPQMIGKLSKYILKDVPLIFDDSSACNPESKSTHR